LPPEPAAIDEVICIPGLWMPGLVMTLLRRRLVKSHGYQARTFTYRSVAGDLAENIERLRWLVENIVAERVHIVAHSLGGVIALQALRRYPDLPVERVVCLGSPLVDSQPARHFLRYNWGKAIVGRTLSESVLERPLGAWTGRQQVGIIAGTVPFGVAKFCMPLAEPNDGVVASIETRLPGIAGHLELPVNHAGLVLSRRVADQSAHFLRDGCFATTRDNA